MKITVISVGKIKEKFFSDAISEYKKRLSRFASLEVVEIKDEKIPENASQREIDLILEKEGAQILAQIPKNSYNIAMCIEGKELSSTEFSQKLDSIKSVNSNITFIIGGSLGLCKKVKSVSDMALSFGKITLPHQLMRVVLLEQIYRAFKISANETYHK
ncbi:MAG: 23S rRNA (pseudouridine(1915)-N(3))-methyltransferase RlmH [Firmicutes bacterium]|nr:23S rRNA (pseudouridine(1915)-N(3))-methyltransferase RlmH [Bacillota bacterium]HAL62819.1 23S rRNA (pseudouridine(1915)-N(3))-methyltransferase RlmH [Clostridiales bacterium]